VLRSTKAGREGDYSLSVSDNVEDKIKVSGLIEPAVKVDLSDPDALPPPWSVVQGWRTSGGGHNFFIVDVHPGSKRALVLESNTASSGLNGPGFRHIGHIDNERPGGIITPNRDNHWTLKLALTWKEIEENYVYGFRVARLRVYDLNWSGPVM
jgi:hypothetical protein